MNVALPVQAGSRAAIITRPNALAFGSRGRSLPGGVAELRPGGVPSSLAWRNVKSVNPKSGLTNGGFAAVVTGPNASAHAQELSVPACLRRSTANPVRASSAAR